MKGVAAARFWYRSWVVNLPLGPGPEIKYLLETYCWGQAPKWSFDKKSGNIWNVFVFSLSLPLVKQGYNPKTIIPCRISWCIGHQSSMSCDARYNTDYLALSSRWGDPEEWSVVVYAWRIWQVLKVSHHFSVRSFKIAARDTVFACIKQELQ